MLRLVNDNGELTEIDAELGGHLERIAELEQQLKDIERERRIERAKLRLALRDKASERTHYHRRGEVEDIFDEWREECGHKRARLTDDRFDGIRALLEVTTPEPYPRQAFTAAISGAKYDPFITTRKNGSQQRHDDLALICRDGKTFDSFIKRAPLAPDQENACASE